jgi:hypothetical protein
MEQVQTSGFKSDDVETPDGQQLLLCRFDYAVVTIILKGGSIITLREIEGYVKF